jgi:hypothetical protein
MIDETQAALPGVHYDLFGNEERAARAAFGTGVGNHPGCGSRSA